MDTRHKLHISIITLILIIIIILIITLISIKFAFAENFIENILSPFEGLDITTIYDKYAQLFDFFIFTTLFIGLAQVTLRKRFEGKGGKAIIISLGTALGIGMLFAEKRWGFSLKSLGNIGFALFIIIMAVFIYRVVLKSAGIGMPSKVSIAYLVTYLCLNLIAKDYFTWVMKKIPFLHGMFVLCLIIIAVNIIRNIVKASKGLSKGIEDNSLGIVSRGFTKAKDLFEKEDEKEITEEKKEKKIEKRKIKEPIKVEKKESKMIIHDLNKIGELVNIYEETGAEGQEIVSKIKDIIKRENIIADKINEIKIYNRKIEHFDYGLLRDFKKEYDEMPDKAKNYIRKEIIDEKKKIRTEEKIKYLENTFQKQDQNFKYCLSMIINYLKNKEFGNARSFLGRAKHFALEENKISDELEKLGKHLIRLTNIGLKLLKKLKKYEHK